MKNPSALLAFAPSSVAVQPINSASSFRTHPQPGNVQRQYASLFADTYNVRSALFDKTMGRPATHQLHRRLAQLPPRPLRVLDLGCGTGRNIARLRRAGVAVSQYVGIDSSSRMLDIANRRRSSDVYRFENQRIEELTILGGYDLVLCTWLLSHLDDPAMGFRVALGNVAAGGSLLTLALAAGPTTAPAKLAAVRFARRLNAPPVDPAVLEPESATYFERSYGGLLAVAEHTR